MTGSFTDSGKSDCSPMKVLSELTEKFWHYPAGIGFDEVQVYY